MVKRTNYTLEPALKKLSIIPYLIQGENAPMILDDFNRLVDRKFRGNEFLKVLKLVEVNGVQVLTGSNPLVLPLVNSLDLYSSRGSRLQTGLPEQVQRTLNDGDTLGIEDNYTIDFGISLDFSRNDHALALDLYKQLPHSKMELMSLPAILLNYGLKNFRKGDYSLGFTCTNGTILRHSLVLSGRGGNFTDRDVSLKTGLPVKLEGGNRRFHTADQDEPHLDNLGVSRFYLGSGLGLDASGGDFDGLANSYDGSRMFCFSG